MFFSCVGTSLNTISALGNEVYVSQGLRERLLRNGMLNRVNYNTRKYWRCYQKTLTLPYGGPSVIHNEPD